MNNFHFSPDSANIVRLRAEIVINMVIAPCYNV